MRIINVITVIDSVVHSVQSYPIVEEQLSQEIVDQAEAEFKRIAIELGADGENEEDMKCYIEEGVFQREEEHFSVCIAWSEIE